MAGAAREPGVSATDRGRRFHGRRKVRLGDVRSTGRLRLDALTRYTQDVSDDDTSDAGLDPEPGWIVRRTSVSVTEPAQLGEELDFVTYCSGLGRRWAERRHEISGSLGASYDVVTLWVCVDPVSGRPRRLTDQFLALYAPSTQGRTVSARLEHPTAPRGDRGRSWPLRAVDFDVFDHMNNAAYWAVFEEVVDGGGPEALQATIEYRGGVGPDDEVRRIERTSESGRRVIWLVKHDDALAASLVIERQATPVLD